jgi:hypothetical protein
MNERREARERFRCRALGERANGSLRLREEAGDARRTVA